MITSMSRGALGAEEPSTHGPRKKRQKQEKKKKEREGKKRRKRRKERNKANDNEKYLRSPPPRPYTGIISLRGMCKDMSQQF